MSPSLSLSLNLSLSLTLNLTLTLPLSLSLNLREEYFRSKNRIEKNQKPVGKTAKSTYFVPMFIYYQVQNFCKLTLLGGSVSERWLSITSRFA